jgi:hypothetical protein
VHGTRRVESGALSENGLWLNRHDHLRERDSMTFFTFQYNLLDPAINPETTIALIGKPDSSY